MYALGIDLGSSSVKFTLFDTQTGAVAGAVQEPEREMTIQAPKESWAEQSPEIWWQHVCKGLRKLLALSHANPAEIKSIGIAYQMHGLVLVDRDLRVLRPAIIWCDSRAVEIGDRAFEDLGHQQCLSRLLNSPGNFTASKLKWVRDNEPDLYAKVRHILLPGDYLAMKLTGEARTTVPGLSEGIFWDFRDEAMATFLLEHYQLDAGLLPQRTPTFGIQGYLTATAAQETGLRKGIPVSYRAGDQPNNALSLNVLNPGEIAATAGTSGVVYGVTDNPVHDPASRVNVFAHVNHADTARRYGILLCINGTGIANSWIRSVLGSPAYQEMNALASQVPPGSGGLRFYPFGNGAERVLGNLDPGAGLQGIRFNHHGKEHILRAIQEGIVFSMKYGLGIMENMGIAAKVIRAGTANLFLSPVFREAFTNTAGVTVELYDTDGSKGAALGGAFGAGLYGSLHEAMSTLTRTMTVHPEPEKVKSYAEAYAMWFDHLAV